MNMALRNLFSVVLVSALAGCTDVAPIRNQYGVMPPCGENQKIDDKTPCAHVDVQKTPSYLLGFVEFDDQGWFWDRNQLTHVLGVMNDELDSHIANQVQDRRGFLVVAYAHGWRHDATERDDNVACFRTMLEIFDKMEQTAKSRKPRQVIGVYLGWRGLSTEGIDPWEIASFWDRKNTAERVGSGALTETLVRLDTFRLAARDRLKTKQNCSGRDGGDNDACVDERDGHLILTGHSFGGQVMQRALSQIIIANGAKNHGRTVSGVGDMTVIVNPAYEASQYQPVHNMAISQCYPVTQKPVMMTVTSEADIATKTVFPLGRFFSTLMEGYRDDAPQSKADRTAAGHFKPFHTAWLTSTEDPVKKKYDKGCPYIKTEDFDVSNDFRKVIKIHKAQRLQGLSTIQRIDGKKGETRERLAEDYALAKLLPNSDFAPNFPYQMIYTHKNVIAGHNEIFSPAFVNFLRLYYLARVYSPDRKLVEADPSSYCFKGGATEESCRRADGGTCRLRPPSSPAPLTPAPWKATQADQS